LSTYPDDRVGEIKLIGFDNIFQAGLTQFVLTTLDEWPAISHPIMQKDIANLWAVWPFFLFMVLLMSIITANLFVSVICYAFGNVAEEESAEEVEKRVKKIRALFQRLDADMSGEIAPQEVFTLADMLGVQMSEEQLAEAVVEMDFDGTGQVDFEEFVEWWSGESKHAVRIRRAVVHEEALIRSSFDKVDIDNSNSLDANEVPLLAKKMGITLTEEEEQRVMFEMDGDGDNDVGFLEFSAWWFSGSTIAAKVSRAAKGETMKMEATFKKLDWDKSGADEFLLYMIHVPY
jgi:calmodulin